MNAEVLAEVSRRFADLERRGTRFRAGVVTAASPLSVALGGSSTAYAGVAALNGYRPVVGDAVAVLTFGSDLVVLDRIAAPDSIHLVSGVGQPAFANSWANFDAATYAAGGRSVRFWKDRGRVYLAGIMKSGVVGSAAFVLPAGYRPLPTGSSFWPVVANSAFGALAIDNAGNVSLTAGSNVFVDLSSVSFSVDI